ncbi:UDP-N-acetylglucosamine 2-epimerase (non-hydrolyzing) [Bacillus sp. DTU_2020_1000418_1_SI_GHA_SEK_038]|uniref:non-hydrolyzing UDP-N-acetylglucosamine 2-epimerase n=1 Tax=Bacillus sp. DTU_2020_1000418_1_SI_GHA_SEK_038 TaxID=3077585 RepID=UPI0028EB1743|nr:UDP-N-acetylglucosamine 2-epimerase (non-hydrolyzing) [Bacillus sp. DTU_2020_1000418_1_SI_GHA_SEK_038]WNS74820.1 UDP-N-acetylglucosamine 2-epimerase (non-hydrolyzing) [Bacillus sp. DTU_2020_1000418_1_SI_GHA_SEK_038]
MKILTVVGTRPQLVKVAPVSRMLRQLVTEVLINTGQHYDYNMAGVFFDELNIPKPDYDLGCGSASHGKQTAAMLQKIEEVMMDERPDAVLVYGDTNSTLAGALAASKLHIPTIHIEAGLRSFDKKMPEEINRVLTDHISSLLFAPTEAAVENLKREGITNNVINAGDVMYDAVLYNTAIAEEKYTLKPFRVTEKNYILATIHRPYNTDSPDKLTAIVHAFEKMQETVIFPVHPRTKQRLEEFGLYDRLYQSSHIQLISPISYLEMLLLEKKAKAIITDSGGVQKEAYFAKVPCITLRSETEWVETVEAGCNHLVNVLNEDLSAVIQEIIPNGDYSKKLFGDGKASEKIVKEILKYFQ